MSSILTVDLNLVLSFGVGSDPGLIQLLHVSLPVLFRQFRQISIVLLIHGYVFLLIPAVTLKKMVGLLTMNNLSEYMLIQAAPNN